MIHYIENHRSDRALQAADFTSIQRPTPHFDSKPAFKLWCADPSTNHVFYSLVEGDTPGLRVTAENPARVVYGIVGDYDAPPTGAFLNDPDFWDNRTKPTWVSTTYRGYRRLVWVFEEPQIVCAQTVEPFLTAIHRALETSSVMPGFDSSSMKPNQYFEVGTDWQQIGALIPTKTVKGCYLKAVQAKPPQTGDTKIPLEEIARWVDERFPGRWGDRSFEIGVRGPLFWIQDGIDREGAQVAEDGMVCYSDRAGKAFVSWREIFGPMVDRFEEHKLGALLDDYWYDGKSFYKVIHEAAASINKDQLVLELKQRGFAARAKKGASLSEVDQAVLAISNENRIDLIAPVVFSSDRIVTYSGSRILNTSNNRPTQPAGDGIPAEFPFLHEWISQLLVPAEDRPTTDYLYSWLSRFYKAVLGYKLRQGQTLLLVGPVGRGKSLLSNKVIGGLVGGFADATAYLTGKTQFNKALGRVPLWVVDDTTSAASYNDQRKLTEMLKRAAANPRIEFMAKYVDATDIPWAGRVVMSLNTDANSLSVLPSMDSSNREKIMALRVSDDARTEFPDNDEVEDIVDRELPYFAQFLLNWKTPQELRKSSRFGVTGFVDHQIESAAFDNSSRSSIAELIEFFVVRHRRIDDTATEWIGTLTEFQVLLHEYNGGRRVGLSDQTEFMRRGMSAMEEAHKGNPQVRPVQSLGNGNGKVWRIDLSSEFDIKVDRE